MELQITRFKHLERFHWSVTLTTFNVASPSFQSILKSESPLYRRFDDLRSANIGSIIRTRKRPSRLFEFYLKKPYKSFENPLSFMIWHTESGKEPATRYGPQASLAPAPHPVQSAL